MATWRSTCHEAIARSVATWAPLPLKIPLSSLVIRGISADSPASCLVRWKCEMVPVARQGLGQERRFVVFLQQETKQAAAKQRLMPRDATDCTIVQPVKVELDGLEPTTPALQTRCSPN